LTVLFDSYAFQDHQHPVAGCDGGGWSNGVKIREGRRGRRSSRSVVVDDTVRCTMELVPLPTKYAPVAVVAFATAVSSMLSRRCALSWAAVIAAPETHVIGAVQATSGPDLMPALRLRQGVEFDPVAHDHHVLAFLGGAYAA
jgi:hypothetical protein